MNLMWGLKDITFFHIGACNCPHTQTNRYGANTFLHIASQPSGESVDSCK